MQGCLWLVMIFRQYLVAAPQFSSMSDVLKQSVHGKSLYSLSLSLALSLSLSLSLSLYALPSILSLICVTPEGIYFYVCLGPSLCIVCLWTETGVSSKARVLLAKSIPEVDEVRLADALLSVCIYGGEIFSECLHLCGLDRRDVLVCFTFFFIIILLSSPLPPYESCFFHLRT